MFYGNSPQDTRQLFYSSWLKNRQKKPLTALEEQIVAVILDHPEYHSLLEAPLTDTIWFPELGQTNPFLHMGLHLAIRDQITTNRPQGMAQVYEKLLKQYHDRMTVEHLLIEQLAEHLWHIQRNQTEFDDVKYLTSCEKLLHL